MSEASSYMKISDSMLYCFLYKHITEYMPSNYTGPYLLNMDNLKSIFIRLIKGLPERYGISKLINPVNGKIDAVDIPVQILLNAQTMDINNSFFVQYWNNINGDILFSGTDIVKCNNDKRYFILKRLITLIGSMILTDIPSNNSIINDDNVEELYVRINIFNKDELSYGIFIYTTKYLDTDNDFNTEKNNQSSEDDKSLSELFGNISMSPECKSLTMSLDILLNDYAVLDDVFKNTGNFPQSTNDIAFMLDTFVRVLLDIDQNQYGKYLTTKISNDFKLSLTDMQLKEFNSISITRIAFNENFDKYLERYDEFVQFVISNICTLMKKAMEFENLSSLNHLIWIFHIDNDVKVYNSIGFGRIIKFDYIKTDNKVLISVKPFNI